MSPPKKKRKTKKPSLKPSPTPESYSISSLPDDLVLSCLARVSRSYYPTISLVCKKFRSLIASPEIYKVRSLLGCTEACLYVCFEVFYDTDNRWFTLSGKPNTRKTKKKKDSNGNILVPIPSHHSTQASHSSVVAIGPSIYFIGGLIDHLRSSNFSILDCRYHTWHQAPNMQLLREKPGANVIDGKIYVVGGRHYKDKNPSKWIEVFDPKTQIWNYVSSPGREICCLEYIHSTVIDGKICIYQFGYDGVAYNPKDGTCEPLELDMCEGWIRNSYCVIDNVLFSYYEEGKVFKWFDTKARLWRNLKGLEKMTRRIAKDSSGKLADYGGKIAVVWDRVVPSSEYKKKAIWCGVVAIERRDSKEEIWGMVEWFEVVHTVHTFGRIVRVLATTL